MRLHQRIRGWYTDYFQKQMPCSHILTHNKDHYVTQCFYLFGPSNNHPGSDLDLIEYYFSIALFMPQYFVYRHHC